jgi:hypothetical protein
MPYDPPENNGGLDYFARDAYGFGYDAAKNDKIDFSKNYLDPPYDYYEYPNAYNSWIKGVVDFHGGQLEFLRRYPQFDNRIGDK